MLRALWFLLKVGLLVAAAVWAADQQGRAQVEWGGYSITFPHIGYFIGALIGIILLAIFIYGFLRGVALFPTHLRRYRRERRREKGYRALTRGLAAVAAGDRKMAVQQAARATKFMPDDAGLPLLLQAQAARLDGRDDDAQQNFAALMLHKDAGFLGVRGLLQAALDAQNFPKALEIARQALTRHPREPWILNLVYDLEIRQRQWAAALETLNKATRFRAMPPARAAQDRRTLMMALASEDMQAGQRDAAITAFKKIITAHPTFSPAAVRLAGLYKDSGQTGKAQAVIKTMWRAAPHPDLAKTWDNLMVGKQGAKPMGRLMWFEKLTATYPLHPESHIVMAQICLEEGLWGEAREHLNAAEESKIAPPTARVYRLRADLERRASRNIDMADAFLERAAAAPPDYAWVCTQTGRVYDSWMPIAPPHNSFNTIDWAPPPDDRALPLLTHDEPLRRGVLDTPQGFVAQ